MNTDIIPFEFKVLDDDTKVSCILPPMSDGFAMPPNRLKSVLESHGFPPELNMDEIIRAYTVFGETGVPVEAVLKRSV